MTGLAGNAAMAFREYCDGQHYSRLLAFGADTTAQTIFMNYLSEVQAIIAADPLRLRILRQWRRFSFRIAG